MSDKRAHQAVRSRREQEMALLGYAPDPRLRAAGWIFDEARNALRDFQAVPKIQRPNFAQSFIPVVGSAWEAAADLQEGDYAGAALNGALAAGEVLPFGVAVKGFNAARKGVTVLKKGSVTADAARKQLKRRGVARKGYKVHHTIPLNGKSRNAQDPRNHYALLKVLPIEQHRRLTGSWQGKPRYDPVRRMWYGATDWQKALPTGFAAYGTDSWGNVAEAPSPHPNPSPRR